MSHVRERRIVVGINGSDESSAALRWAVRQAGLTGAIVDPVKGLADPGDTSLRQRAVHRPAFRRLTQRIPAPPNS
jgi:Universal stress protein family